MTTGLSDCLVGFAISETRLGECRTCLMAGKIGSAFVADTEAGRNFLSLLIVRNEFERRGSNTVGSELESSKALISNSSKSPKDLALEGILLEVAFKPPHLGSMAEEIFSSDAICLKRSIALAFAALRSLGVVRGSTKGSGISKGDIGAVTDVDKVCWLQFDR